MGPPVHYLLPRCGSQQLRAFSPFPNGKLYFLFIRKGARWHWEQSSVSYRILSLAVTLGDLLGVRVSSAFSCNSPWAHISP